MASPILVGLDAGTTSTRAIAFDKNGNSLDSYQREHEQIYPHPGWVEHNPLELYQSAKECLDKLASQLASSGRKSDVMALGVTNQRETTVCWSRSTGKPLYNAIVWLDTRTSDIVSQMAGNEGKDRFRAISGLPLSPYFSASKIKWMIDNVDEVTRAVAEGDAMFGTVDSWLIYNLTGGVDGGQHVTDATNASRTLLMNLHSLQWDEDLCKAFGVSIASLPRILPSASVFGVVRGGGFDGVRIASCLGDQHAACVGQGLQSAGTAKNTYGTGCFLMMNVGSAPRHSSHGLLSTVAYQLREGEAVYALEGSVAIAGAAVQWLRDNLGLIKSSADIETISSSVSDCGGVTFVPAFSGMFAPYWRDDARGVIVGLSGHSTSAHICRAVLEAICFQTCDIVEAMQKDSGMTLEKLRVDGGVTANKLCMQMQADLLGVDVSKPDMAEMTALGAALAAGLAVGVYAAEEEMWKVCGAGSAHTFAPSISEEERNRRLVRWHDAVNRTFNLADKN